MPAAQRIVCTNNIRPAWSGTLNVNALVAQLILLWVSVTKRSEKAPAVFVLLGATISEKLRK